VEDIRHWEYLFRSQKIFSLSPGLFFPEEGRRATERAENRQDPPEYRTVRLLGTAKDGVAAIAGY